MNTSRSKQLLERARNVIPGGVNSPVRAFGSVGGQARFIRSASGARIVDEDGNSYIDYVASWGAILHGHAHPVVLEAIARAAARGTSFGAPTEAEIALAERVCQLVPSLEMVRLVCSGTEATMSAIRLARGATGRDRVLKFDGCYHGHPDHMLAAAGSGVATLGIPGTDGVPRAAVADTVVLPFNDLEAVESLFASRGAEIAAVIVEPVAANMGLVPPVAGFLSGLRSICDRHGALLIFDEVITGFRVALGGAQARFGVAPDLTTFGKVIGGGLPVGAYGGRRALMERMAPLGPVYQAGTLSGNPLATAAGLAALELAAQPGVYERLEAGTKRMADGLAGLAREAGVPFTASSLGGVFGFFFHPGPVRSYADAQKCDTAAFRSFFHSMLEQGIYLAPSPFEAGFLTCAHGDSELDQTLEAARRAFARAT
ncbi:MAG: glutamate-1-semialdehyde-2,1-aminomutase [Deltaproteobacteria bacterium]|nr:glutamate-1-semialdehyde-2,1-aminomutase [Deltaproteobacteria bacterium]